MTQKDRTDALEAYRHLSPTHTPNCSGLDASLLAAPTATYYPDEASFLAREHVSLASRGTETEAVASGFSYSAQHTPHHTSPHRAARLHKTFHDSALAGTNALGSPGVGRSIGGGIAGFAPPSNILNAVLSLVKELDGDQLLAVQSHVSLRLEALSRGH